MPLQQMSLTPAELDAALQQLRKAKSAHLRWRAYAMVLSAGYAVEEGQLPLRETECQFGCWYYGEGQLLKDLPAFKAIEAPHQELHAIYQDIFQQLFNQEEPSFWKKLLGSKSNNPRPEELEEQLSRLTECSKAMLEELDALEQILTRSQL